MLASINGVRIAYAEGGIASAPAVVLHHPLATEMRFWDATVGHLAKQYRVICFDARGHGHSETRVGPYDFDTLALDVVALMDHLDISRAQFVGLSMGGMVAQVLGLAHPDRFTSLTVASAGSRTPEAMRGAWLGRIETVRAQGMESQVDMSVARWLTEATRARHPELAARCAAMIRATPVEGYAGWCAAIAGLDLLDRLPDIGLPVAVIAGGEDQAVPLAAAEAMAKALPNAQLTIIPDAAHFSVLEKPDAFHDALLPFLAAHA